MTDTTPNLALPELIAAQAQKHVTVNEALRALDVLVQLCLLDRDLTAPPPSPNDGERWLVGPSPTGAWAGHGGDIAAFSDGAWEFFEPRTGWLAYVADEGALLAWTGSAWVDAITALTSLNNMTLLGVGTMADATNPFSAKLNNILWAAKTAAEGGDGDLRWKMNKETTADTLSMLFETAYSGRAEIGLTGDDNLHVKVSPDGTSWIDALSLDRTTGGIRLLANETSIAAAATCDIGAAASLKVQITGTTTITSFGTVANAIKLLRFAGALTLTHNATSLVLQGAANIVTAAGDTALAVSDASGYWRLMAFAKADGTSVARPSFSAHKNGTAQASIAASTFTKLTFTTESWDTGGYFDAANSRWTPPAGKGVIGVKMLISGGIVDQALAILRLYKNGSGSAQYFSNFSGTQNQTVEMTAPISANGTDYFEAYVYIEGAGTKTIGGDPDVTGFFGHME